MRTGGCVLRGVCGLLRVVFGVLGAAGCLRLMSRGIWATMTLTGRCIRVLSIVRATGLPQVVGSVGDGRSRAGVWAARWW